VSCGEITVWEHWHQTQLRNAAKARSWYYAYLSEPLIADEQAIRLMGKAAADIHYHMGMATWWEELQAAGRTALTTAEISKHSAKLRRQIKESLPSAWQAA